MKVEAIRSASGAIYAIRKRKGYAEYFTTVVIRSGMYGLVRGFTYGMGSLVAGTNAANATQLDTNLRGVGIFDDAVWVGLEWRLPLFSPARFQPDPSGGDYPVTQNDLNEFIGKAFIRLFLGSEDRPYVEYPVNSLDLSRSEFRIAQQVRFATSYTHRSDGSERVWAEVDFPVAPPIFGKHPKTGQPGALTVIFKLMEQEQTQPQAIVPLVEREPVEAPKQSVDWRRFASVLDTDLSTVPVTGKATYLTPEAAMELAANKQEPENAPDAQIDEARFRNLEGDGK